MPENALLVYNSNMTLSPESMRIGLFLCLLGMAVISALYLRQRRLSISAYFGWGLLIILVPLVGPFVVILAHPGEKRQV